MTFVCSACGELVLDFLRGCPRCGPAEPVAQTCGTCVGATRIGANFCLLCHARQSPDLELHQALLVMDHAAVLMDQGRHQQSLSWSQLAIRSHPDVPPIRRGHAELTMRHATWLIDRRSAHAALALLDSALEDVPDSSELRFGRAQALAALGRDNDAWLALRAWCDADPKNPNVPHALARWVASGRRLGDLAGFEGSDTDQDVARAVEVLRRARELDEIQRLDQREAPELKRQLRMGGRWKIARDSLTVLRGRSDATDSARAMEMDAASLDHASEPPVSAGARDVAELLASADRLADAGALSPAIAEVERALAIDIGTPGGTERWRRWGALAREAAWTRAALAGARPDDRNTARKELREAARELEASHEVAAAAAAWALAGDERARLRLLGRPHVCAALVDRLASLCAESMGAASPDGAIASLVLEGRRREALELAQVALSNEERPRLAELAALVLALAIRGPRLDVRIGPEASERLQVALGQRVTLGRLGAGIRVTGPGVAPEHVAVWRDEEGAPLLADVGTAMGTTLAGARLAAPLPIGGGLRVELGGRVPLHAAPLEPTRCDSPVVLEVGGERYVAPLGALVCSTGGELAPKHALAWTIQVEDAPRDPGGPGLPWTVLRAPPGEEAIVAGRPASAVVDLCFGDIVHTRSDRRLLAVEPPVESV